MRNIKLVIAYDGTHFLGWQKTKMGRSIEQSLQEVLEQILQHPISLQAASRTDAGVHAKGQVVNFFTDKQTLSLEKLFTSLNHLLPKDIAVLRIEEALPNFHPTLDSLRKEYHYHLCSGTVQLPCQRLYSWHYPYQLDIQKMRKAASYFLGEHDFSAFCNKKKNEVYADHVRDSQKIEIVELPNNCFRFELVGNSFLYKMVRNIVGTLVYVGCGKINGDSIPAILRNRKRTHAGVTAPAHGLFLNQIEEACRIPSCNENKN